VSERGGDHTLDELVGAEEAREDSEDRATAVAAPAALRKQGETGGSGVRPGPTLESRLSQPLPSAQLSGAPTTAGGTTATSLAALHHEEIARTRSFSIIALGIAGAVAVALPLLGGDPLARKLLMAGLVVAAVPTVWFMLLIRDDQAYTVGRVTFVAYCLIVAAYTGVFFWGVFSPAPAVVILGIYFFSLSGSFQATVLIYLTCASAHALLSGLVIGGVMADRGLITADHLDFHEPIITQAVVQFLFLCAFVIARSSRRSTLEAVSELELAIRQVAQREAQLQEAKQDLDRALRVGGPGRYTEQQVGSFVLGVLIGRGGMGEVYEAVHHQHGQPAAVKLLHKHVAENPDHLSRFMREMETAGKIRSDYVTAVLEVGATEGEVPFMAMERLAGHDLAYHLRRRRRLSPRKVVALVRQVGRGLEAAHRAGVIHRDIKPQNLFLAELPNGRAQWKILDFGVSKLAGGRGTLTRGHVVGTPGYMAPEQARGEHVDNRADLYALAAIAYRALTGQAPFSGKDVPSTLYEVVYKTPARPSELTELPADIDRVLAIGLAKDPDDRFASGEELADALGDAARGELSDELRRRAERLQEDWPWAKA
jgi:eukaryotic-like serine/threonine-protein kinase